jgi:hypothetical protein
MKTLMTSLILFASVSLGFANNEAPIDPELLELFDALYSDPVEEAGLKLDEFAQKLGINASQQAAWDRFRNHVLDQVQQKQQRAAELREFIQNRNGQPLSTPEALDLKIHHLQLMLADAQQARNLIADLYQQLSDQQQQVFDRVIRAIWFNQKFKQHRS